MRFKRALEVLAAGALGAAVCLSAPAEEAGPVSPVIESPCGERIIYGQSLSESPLLGGMAADPVTGQPVEGCFAWANGDYVPGVGVQMCLCEFRPTGFDAEFYLPVTFRAEVEVGRIPTSVSEEPQCVRHIRFGESIALAGLAGGVCVDAAGAGIDGTWSFAEGEAHPPVGMFNAEVRFTPRDSFHYEEARCIVEGECEPCVPEVAVYCTGAQPGQPLSSCTLSGWAAGADGALIGGVFAFCEPTLIPEADGGMHDVIFTPDDGSSYLPVQVQVAVVFGLRGVTVEAVLELGPDQDPAEGTLRLKAVDADGQDVDGDLVFDERFEEETVFRDGERIGAVFVPRDPSVYSEVPVSVKVVIK